VFLNPLSDRVEMTRATAGLLARTWWVGLLSGLIAIVFGILILTIDWTVESLAIFVGIWECVVAFEVRNLARRLATQG
jgi:uncharacterized membrane protein HdeD (DUF308 family)